MPEETHVGTGGGANEQMTELYVGTGGGANEQLTELWVGTGGGAASRVYTQVGDLNAPTGLAANARRELEAALKLDPKDAEASAELKSL